MKYLILTLLIGFVYSVNAQEVNFNGVTYEIKKDQIFKDNVDVTEGLSIEEKQQIIAAFDNKMAQIKESEKTAKRLKKAEKDQKNAEKKQKKAEKALKQKKKAESNFQKAEKRYNDGLKKYEKLKKKGNLSPNDEEKWLKKIDALNRDLKKAKGKL